MVTVSRDALQQVAEQIRPYITPFIERDGYVSYDTVRLLAKEYATHKVSSERSCRLVEQYLCEM